MAGTQKGQISVIRQPNQLVKPSLASGATRVVLSESLREKSEKQKNKIPLTSHLKVVLLKPLKMNEA